MKNFGIKQIGFHQTGTVKGGLQPQNQPKSWGFVNKRPIPGLPNSTTSKKKQKAEEGAKIHKPNGHRSILDNGWIPTKRLKKGTYGLVKRNNSRK